MTDRDSRPAGTRSIEAIQDEFRSRDYIADRSLATAVFLALELGRPLLLEGEAGVGKTELAKVLAASLGARLIRLQCYEGLDVNTAVYEWNYPRQMLEIRLLEARGEADHATAHDIFGRDFLIRRPLLQALEATDGVAPVLLIDEIDRADEEFEAYLLEILSDFQVTVPEIGTIQAETPPRVILTSNRTREVHDALKRRCLYHWIDYPTAQKEFEIVLARVPEAPERLAREVVGFVHRLREADLTKVPGIAETLDWAAALLSLGARELAPELVDETLGVVLKYEEDIRHVRGGETRRYLGEAAAGGDVHMTGPRDEAIVTAPGGATVDGRRLLARGGRVRAGAAGRAAGDRPRRGGRLRPGADARRHRRPRAGPRRRRGGLRPAPRRPRRSTTRSFDRWWRAAARACPTTSARRRCRATSATERGPGGRRRDASPRPATSVASCSPTSAASPIPSDGDDDADDQPIEGVIISPDAYSQGEVLRHREFDRMTPAELRDAERLVDLLVPRLEQRRTRRYELHSHGRRLAPRAMFRRNLGTGGQLLTWVWRRPDQASRARSSSCATSRARWSATRGCCCGSSRRSRRRPRCKTESFVFGTRLTRVTRLLRDRDRDRALARVADSVNDWAGGTRIGESFRTFNQHWARRTLRTRGVVIVVSDGWDRGDPALVATETARLRRNCHRLVWLNPLAGTPGYQPLAGGMRAAFPYIDDFLPAGTVACLERLGEILGGVRAGDTRRGSEAAAHAALPGATVRGRASRRAAPSSAVRPSTRSAPRPLR